MFCERSESLGGLEGRLGKVDVNHNSLLVLLLCQGGDFFAVGW